MKHIVIKIDTATPIDDNTYLKNIIAEEIASLIGIAEVDIEIEEE